MIKIDKNIPMPAKGLRSTTLPIANLEVGESFAVPAARNGDVRKTQIRTATTCHQVGKKLGRSFATRRLNERGEDVVRVWRLD